MEARRDEEADAVATAAADAVRVPAAVGSMAASRCAAR
jgi:hypothetical protein